MSANKFKEGDIVKCVNNYGLYHGSLTVGKEYKVLQNNSGDAVVFENDDGVRAYYCLSRFELSKSVETSQQPKFKEGDMVYLIGFGCLKPRKLQTGFNNGLPMEFKVEINDVFETFTEDGKYLTIDIAPRIVLATEENRQMLNKLLGVEYEPVKLTGSDLTKKLLKDNPQTCYVSDVSDDYASSNKRKRIGLISKFENGAFITMSDVHWKYAVPCNQHGEVLEDK